MENPVKRILIFYTSVGLGHKIIAENIGWHLQQAGYEVQLADILAVQSGALVNFGTSVHQFVNTKLPWLWRGVYTSDIFNFFTLPLRVPLAAKNSARAESLIRQFNPDLVITTQTTASAIVSNLKQRGLYRGKFAIAFSDYHYHPYWRYAGADRYFANIPEQKDILVAAGEDPAKIFVVGMTLQPHAVVDAAEVRQRLGLAPEEKVVLIASGSLGTGVSARQMQQLVRELSGGSTVRIRPVIVTGKNVTLKAELDQMLAGTPAIVFGYYKPLAELYAVADLFITKPGGLTVAEALSWQLPLIITHWLPGGEDLNYSYLKAKNLILDVPGGFVKPKELAAVVMRELSSGEFKKSLASNPAWQELIQQKRLGQAIIEAVSTMFHKV